MATREATAWESIGWDDGPFRVKGGRVYWQAVMYNCANNGRLVKLARIEQTADDSLRGFPCREFSRYVEPDTVLVFDVPEDQETSGE